MGVERPWISTENPCEAAGNGGNGSLVAVAAGTGSRGRSTSPSLSPVRRDRWVVGASWGVTCHDLT